MNENGTTTYQLTKRTGIKYELLRRSLHNERKLTADELEEVSVNGKKGVQLRLYFGSSTYDTKEMSVLLDGIVSECRELGIEPDTKMKVLLSDGSNYFAE